MKNIKVEKAEMQLYPEVGSCVPPIAVAILFWTQPQTSEAYIESRSKSCRLSGSGDAVLRVDFCLGQKMSFSTSLTGVLGKVLG